MPEAEEQAQMGEEAYPKEMGNPEEKEIVEINTEPTALETVKEIPRKTNMIEASVEWERPERASR